MITNKKRGIIMTQVKHGAAADVATFTNQNSLPKTKAVLNQVVSDLYTARIALHQVHWYMRGCRLHGMASKNGRIHGYN